MEVTRRRGLVGTDHSSQAFADGRPVVPRVRHASMICERETRIRHTRRGQPEGLQAPPDTRMCLAIATFGAVSGATFRISGTTEKV